MGSNANMWSNQFNPFQGFKVLCHYDRMKKIQTGNFDAPVNIALDLVQGTQQNKKCGGLHCNFCMSDFEEKSQAAVIPDDVLFDIPQFYREWGVLSVCMAGHHSDTLMFNHNKLAKFLRLMYKNDIEIGLVTNGLLMTSGIAQEAARNCKWTGFSVNAGKSETHRKITGSDTFERIIANIANLTDYSKTFELDHPVGYKFLITDENHEEIYDAIKVAKDIGCRHMQIRPCELPEERSSKIDISIVEEQILRGIEELEVPGKFEVFGIREKFTPDFKKDPPKRCIVSPIGSTWMADGNVVICPDRRWSAHLPNMTLGNFVTEGLEAIRRKWGGPEHKAMIEEANKHIGTCIRCTHAANQKMYENTVASDPMDLRLI